MTYQNIQPPFTLKFREMSKRELADYAKWFHASIPERIAQLESAVRSTPGYESWRATAEPETLGSLGAWFVDHVTVRPRSPEEIAQLQQRSAMLASPPTTDLTNETFSLAMDIGMYFARTLQQAYPQLQWTQYLDNKKFAHYGQPVLIGFGVVPLNPVHIAVTLGYGIAAGKQKGTRLTELFAVWSKQAVKAAN